MVKTKRRQSIASEQGRVRANRLEPHPGHSQAAPSEQASGVAGTSTPPPGSLLGRSRFGRRTRTVLIVLVILLSPLAYRSWGIYQLRKLAWDASEARQAGNWADLEAAAVRWGQADQGSAMPWALAAEAAEMRGAADRAAAHLEKMPADDPRTPTVLMELAAIYFGKLNRPLDGVATYHKALAIAPDFAEAHRRLIFYYGITVQRRKMVEQARVALRLGCESPETYVYLIGADWLVFSNAYDLNQKWLQSGADNETYEVAQMIHWSGATGYDDFGRAAEHERLLSEVFKKYPENPELLAYFLSQRATRGDRDGVAELLAKVPVSAGDDNRFWHFKGWLDAANENWADAEAAYREALKRNPYAWQTHLELSSVLRQQQRFDEVERHVALSMKGKELRKTILQLPDVQSVSPELLREMQVYASQCGDTAVAERLAARLTQWDGAG